MKSPYSTLPYLEIIQNMILTHGGSLQQWHAYTSREVMDLG